MAILYHCASKRCAYRVRFLFQLIRIDIFVTVVVGFILRIALGTIPRTLLCVAL